MDIIKILNWYIENGVTEITSNKPHNSEIVKDNFQNSIIGEKTMPKPAIKIKDGSLAHLTSNAQQESRNIADQATDLADLKEKVINFDNCILKKTATNTVFADGQEKAKFMLIGEAPGANEDLQGLPFCGDSGKLLDLVLESISISRKSNLYITNTVFWRPPGNRKPTDQELRICLPFLEKHIAIIKPELLILSGSVAAELLLAKKSSISTLRQKTFSYSNKYLDHDIKVVVIFHPSYLLRQPSQKKSMWKDMLYVKENFDHLFS